MPLKPLKIKKRLDIVKSDPWSAAKYITKFRMRVPAWEKYIIKDPKAALHYAKYSMPGKKWPELEKLIIHDPVLIFDYTKNALGYRWEEAEPNLVKDVYSAIGYARDFGIIKWPNLVNEIMKHKDKQALLMYMRYVTRERDPELEKLIINDPESIYNYATKNLRHRWVEAEPNLLKDVNTAIGYAAEFGIIKWLDLEKEIIKRKDKQAALMYAKYVTDRERVPELEHLFIGDPGYVNAYVYDVIDGPWPEAEETLLKKPKYATNYAIDLKKQRWPELEQILKSGYPDLWKKYKEHFKSIYKM